MNLPFAKTSLDGSHYIPRITVVDVAISIESDVTIQRPDAAVRVERGAK